MAKYIIEIPDEVPVSDGCVPFDMCRPSWYSEAYEKGKSEAEDEVWEFAKKMVSMSGNEMSDIWGCTTNFGEVMHNTTYSEAKAKYDAWRSRFVTINNKRYRIVKEGDGKCILEEI